MLPKSRRLSSKAIPGVRGNGMMRYSRYFRVWYLPAQDGSYAISVGTRIHKNAVVRNRIRRRVYALIRAYSQDVPYSIFLQARQDTSTIAHQDLKTDLFGLLDKIQQ